MPIAEVYTISGAGLLPPAYERSDLANRRIGVVSAAPAPVSVPAAAVASSGSPAAQLQNALKALGTTAGDSALMSVAVDGVIGPNTVKAVNHALATYVGTTSAFPRADLTVTKVRQFAGALAALIIQRVQKSGGTVPPVQVAKARSRSSSAASAFVPLPDLHPTSDRKWIWWVVGGVILLVILVAAGGVARKKLKGA